MTRRRPMRRAAPQGAAEHNRVSWRAPANDGSPPNPAVGSAANGIAALDPKQTEAVTRLSSMWRSVQSQLISRTALVRYDHRLITLAGPGGTHPLSCKLDECLDQGRQVLAARIYDIQAASRRRVIVEDAAQPPILDRRLGDPVR